MTDPEHEHVEPAHSHTSRPAVARERTWDWTGMVVRLVLTLVGAAGMVISAFMDWGQGNNADDISVRALWSTNFRHAGDNWITTLAFVMVVLGLLALVGLAPRTGWLTSLAGALGVAAVVLLLVQLYRADLTVNDLGPGAWIGFAGGVIALVAGFFGSRTAVVTTAPATVVEP